jgi:hypothetical protein
VTERLESHGVKFSKVPRRRKLPVLRLPEIAKNEAGEVMMISIFAR